MLSKLHYISQGATPTQHLEHIQKACVSGIELVQLRLKNVSEDVVLETAKLAREITSKHNVSLIINDHYKIAAQVEADGVHLGKSDTCPLIAKAALASWQIIGGTANTFEDCQTLINKNVDYIGLGPYRFTKTKTKLSPILGRQGYETIIKQLQTKTPIVAIGGIVLKDVSEIIKTGVYGIAVSGQITKDFNAIPKLNELINSDYSNAL
ncbi:thiamine phosphate synthase [Olleya sp. ITB9]|uniref:thiamine phosphate synthase n=1 Tax=Olleya sp. ITB9 TaxID=1715648 RepID=UPI0006D11FF2|nr:thiamine phosphate synthase [Olleya sp. ITB9]